MHDLPQSFQNPGAWRRGGFLVLAYLLVPVIGAADFLTGIQLSLLVFYFIPVALAVAAGGGRHGAIVAVASVATWLAADYAAGARFSSPFVPCWNALIALGTYAVLIWLLSKLLHLHREMDARVRQRTAALVEEMAQRERLEKAVLEIGQRERLAIGRELHDGLGQHLTGTALIAQAVSGRLSSRGAPEAAEVGKIVGLVEQGIEQTRSLARGLLLTAAEPEDLAGALEELAASARAQFSVECEVDARGPANLQDGAASHVVRIAQEAVRNAARHGRARRIRIVWAADARGWRCTVTDDGVGLPPPEKRGQGLGLQIMRHRAQIIGAELSVDSGPDGGTVVACRCTASSSPP